MSERKATTEQMPMQFRAATVVPNSVNMEARTVDVVWTTGARVKRGYFTQYWEELDTDPKSVRLKRLNNGAPLLNSHDGSDANTVVGVVQAKTARMEKGKGLATVRFAKAEDDPIADQIFRKVVDGILQNISVGYATYEMEEAGEAPDGLPILRAIDWEPYELSVVPMGADDGAGFRSADPERTTPCVVKRAATPTTVKGKKTMADETETTTTAPQDAPSAVATRAQNDVDHAVSAANEAQRAQRMADAKERAAAIQAAKEEALEAERGRVVGIRQIAQRHKLGEPWASALIDAGASVDRARAAALEIISKGDDAGSPSDGGHMRFGAGDDERDKRIRAATSWLIERTGKRQMLERAKQRHPELFDGLEFGGGNQFRGMSPIEIARDMLQHARVDTRGVDKMRMLGIAFTYRAGAYQTTSDFATLLENTFNKLLLGSYATQDTTWQTFCGTDEVPDFRQSNRYRTGSLPSLPKIAEHGEYKNAAIPDGAKYQISTERHGEIFSLSREAIVNDDMGALANLAMEFGKAAARTIENDVYNLLSQNGGLGPTMADTNPFFSAGRGNINGTGSALSVVGLDADRVLMRAQKDPAGLDYLSLTPAILLVPDALAGTAKVINNAQYDPDTANKLQRPNMVQGLFRDIVGTPRLAANTTRRYLFSDPAICAAIVVAYLEGYGRGPIMESQNGWRVDGVEWRITQYAKAQPGDPKGAVTNAGA